MDNRRDVILCGDALAVLRTLPDSYVQCVVTSPPYYQLRDYGTAMQIGLEATPEQYVDTLVAVFREVRRVLRADGVLWLNLGDTYASRPSWGRGSSSTLEGRKQSAIGGPERSMTGLRPKQLLGIPWRTAIALQEDGWLLRSEVIWHKPNCFPESVKDRPTRSHEQLFLFAKSGRYFYDADAIRETNVTRSNRRNKRQEAYGAQAHYKPVSSGEREWNHPLGHNKRTVWTIATQPYAVAHFATFPPKLVEPCILAGSRQSDIVLDPFVGSGTVPMVALAHGRHYIGIDLNAEYCALAEQRIARARQVIESVA